MGKTPERGNKRYWSEATIPWVSISDMLPSQYINNTKEKITEIALKEVFKERLSPKGTLLMSFKLTVGRTSILDFDAVHNEAIISIYPYKSLQQDFQEYLLYFLPIFSSLAQSHDAIKGKTLNSKSIDNILIPLPPENEQKRIVNKFKIISIASNNIYENQEELNKLKDGLKNKVLDLAIQGKLVEQDPNDEPASVLLEKIKAEKAELVKQGKIKKDKQESRIFKGDDNRHYEKIGSEVRDITDEIPFEIPNSWSWVRFANVSLYSTDYVANGSFASLRENVKMYKEKNFALLVKTQDFSNNFSRDLTYIDERSYNFLEKSKLYGGELMMSNIGASIGKVFIIPNLNMPMSIAPNSIIIKFSDTHITQYVNYLISSPFGQDILKVFTAGTAMPKFSKTQLRGCLIPIPPYKEQIRIVNKMKKLFDMIENL